MMNLIELFLTNIISRILTAQDYVNKIKYILYFPKITFCINSSDIFNKNYLNPRRYPRHVAIRYPRFYKKIKKYFHEAISDFNFS